MKCWKDQLTNNQVAVCSVNPDFRNFGWSDQALLQSRIYQTIRNGAQEIYEYHHNIAKAFVTYALPVLYTVLG
jgi:hypothetical protein